MSVMTAVFSLCLDQYKKFEDTIYFGNYDWVDPEITALHFPLNRRKGKQKVKLVDCSCLGAEATTKAVVDYLLSEKLKLASSSLLRAFGHQFPDVQRTVWIVALGTMAKIRLHRQHCLVLTGTNKARSLTTRCAISQHEKCLWLTRKYKFLCLSP